MSLLISNLKEMKLIELLELAKQGNKQANNFFQWYGISIIDEKGEWKDLYTVFDELNKRESKFTN